MRPSCLASYLEWPGCAWEKLQFQVLSEESGLAQRSLGLGRYGMSDASQESVHSIKHLRLEGLRVASCPEPEPGRGRS